MSDDRRPEFLEIDTAEGRRWVGLLAYVVLFVAVSGVLVLMFMWFTASLRLALGVVMFLVGYMLLMGWWAGRNVEGHDE